MKLHWEQYQSTLCESATTLTQGSEYPVRLRPICSKLSVHAIRRENLEGAKSLLIDAQVRPVIILNRSLAGASTPKAPFNHLERFVIAHELGHLVLHQNGGKNPSGTSEYWRLETLCDEFARRLLIPEKLISSLIGKTGPTALDQLSATIRLSKTCATPWSTAARRLTEIQGGAVFFRLKQMPSGGFKIVVSTQARHQGIGQQIKPGTAICEFLSERLRTACGVTEIEGRQLLGLADIEIVRSAAALSFAGGLLLAAVPAQITAGGA